MKYMNAKMNSFLKGYHYKNDHHHIYKERQARKILGDDYWSIEENLLENAKMFLPEFRGDDEETLDLIVRKLAPVVLGRSAYNLDKLERETILGCNQYIQFSSGYDTLSMDHTCLKVFELDLPEILVDKQRRLKEYKMVSQVTFIPCDIREPDTIKQLLNTEYSIIQKAFGSLLGISYSIEKENFKQLLQQLSNQMCINSSICFDYLSYNHDLDAIKTRQLIEPITTYYTYSQLEKILESCGFLIYEHINHSRINEYYFNTYNETHLENEMKVPQGVHYILAIKHR